MCVSGRCPPNAKSRAFKRSRKKYFVSGSFIFGFSLFSNLSNFSKKRKPKVLSSSSNRICLFLRSSKSIKSRDRPKLLISNFSCRRVAKLFFADQCSKQFLCGCMRSWRMAACQMATCQMAACQMATC